MATLVATDLIRNRFRGALIGALIGDCYGAPFEHRRSANPATLLNDIDSLSKNKNTLQYTDDTAMSISTCKSLIENKGLDSRHLARLFSETYFTEPGRGYGPAVKTVFAALRETKYQEPFGPAANQFDGKGSFGNGAAMRCIGVGLFAHREKLGNKSTIDISESCARITHSHLHGINGATLLVLAVKYVLALGEDELEEFAFLEYLISTVGELEHENDRIYTQKLKMIQKVLEELNVSGSDTNQTEIVRLLGNNVTAQSSVPLAIYSFLRGVSKFNDSYRIDNEFLRTLHWAISCGGDTDTIASMACGLSGAYLGLHKIPENLYKNCEAWRDIINYADQMLINDSNHD